MKHVRGACAYRWRFESAASQPISIPLCNLLALFAPMVKMTKFHAKNSSLEGIEPTVRADDGMLIFCCAAMLSELCNALDETGVI